MRLCCALVASLSRVRCVFVAGSSKAYSRRRGVFMDDRFEDILDTLPDKRPRSCLEPYGKLIDELRRRGRTYRDIAHILAERFQLRVWASTVQRFVRIQLRARRKPQERRMPESPSPRKVISGGAAQVSADEVRQRIEALKRRPVPTDTTPERFHYDPTEPLRLIRKTGENES